MKDCSKNPWAEICSVFSDPGVLLSIGNVFLFSQVSKMSFVVIFLAFLAIFFSKSIGIWQRFKSDLFTHQALRRFFQKGYLGLEIMGYACLFVALLAIVSGAIYGVICGLCFGFANLILAYRFEKGSSQVSLNTVDNELKKAIQLHKSSLHLVLTLVREPIILIAIGMIHAGLSAGGESLWAIPIMLLGPCLLLLNPSLNRALPQLLFGVGSFWYTMVGLSNKEVLATLANACFMVAFFLIAWHENKLHLKKS